MFLQDTRALREVSWQLFSPLTAVAALETIHGLMVHAVHVALPSQCSASTTVLWQKHHQP